MYISSDTSFVINTCTLHFSSDTMFFFNALYFSSGTVFMITFGLFRRSAFLADPEGTGGPHPPPPLENFKNIGFLSSNGSDPLKNYKATKPAFNVGPSSARQRNAI